jgi:hypothetical protein
VKPVVVAEPTETHVAEPSVTMADMLGVDANAVPNVTGRSKVVP